MLRQPAVAGQFYPGSASQLRSSLGEMIDESEEKIRVKGIIAPHAGYMYSGGIAGKLYGRIKIPSAVLLIGPNHHGAGEAAALYPDGEWITPLGSVPVNSRLNHLIRSHAPLVQFDTLAHRFEHSLEVQLPFIQYLRPDVSISALCLGNGNFRTLCEIGDGIAQAIVEYGEEVLIVASSDMTHYESADSAKLKDNLAIERVLAFDPEGLLRVCRASKITMCGVVPATVMLVAARHLGAIGAKVVCYGTSGDITGDNSQVVAYASIAVF